MAKLTLVAMELLTTLIKGGMPYEKAIAFVNGIEDTTVAAVKNSSKQNSFSKTETKNSTASKGSKDTKTSKKSDDKPTTKGSKDSTKKLDFGKVKVGDYFKVFNFNTNKVCNVGKAKEVNKNEKIVYSVVDGTLKKGFALENCVAISAKEFGKLKKSLGLTKGKKEPKVSTSKRLNEHDYTVVLAHLAKQQKAEIDLVDLANNSQNPKDLKDIRDQIHKDLPDLKLTAEQAVKEFASLTEKVSA